MEEVVKPPGAVQGVQPPQNIQAICSNQSLLGMLITYYGALSVFVSNF